MSYLVYSLGNLYDLLDSDRPDFHKNMPLDSKMDLLVVQYCTVYFTLTDTSQLKVIVMKKQLACI